MTMTINVTPAGMTQAQREAVAGFILAYPAAHATECHIHVNAEIAESTVCEELHQLHRESTAPGTPAQAFAVDPAQAAFATLPTPGPTAQDLGRPLTAAEAPAATFGAANVPPPPGVDPVPFAVTATAPAGSTPSPSSAPVAAGVETDRDGLPWDARIHSSNRAKIADGTWRKKRGVDDALVLQVEAELRQVMGAPAAVPLAVPIATTPAPAAPVSASSPTITALPPVAPVPPPPVALAPVPQPAAVGSMAAFGQAVAADARQTFVQLVGRSAAAISAGKLTQQEVTACCEQAGVPMLPLLANRLDLVPGVAADIDAIIKSRG